MDGGVCRARSALLSRCMCWCCYTSRGSNQSQDMGGREDFFFSSSISILYLETESSVACETASVMEIAHTQSLLFHPWISSPRQLAARWHFIPTFRNFINAVLPTHLQVFCGLFLNPLPRTPRFSLSFFFFFLNIIIFFYKKKTK